MKYTPVLCLALTLTGIGVAAAQDSSDMKPPAVIQINREMLKPGKGGAMHDKTEAAFVSLMNKGKLQGHYIALNSMSGKSRALYIARYPSFAAWEADNKIFEKNASLGAELDRDIVADADLLESMDSVVLTYDDDLSYKPRPDYSHARYYDLTVFHIKLGHDKQWHDLTKMYKEACQKAGVDFHWGTYGLVYGGQGGTYLSLTHRDSLAEIDKEIAETNKLWEGMDSEAAAKLNQMFAETVDSVQTELFAINPKQSYVDEATIKADADFWKPKAAAPKAASTATTKPAAATPAKPSSR